MIAQSTILRWYPELKYGKKKTQLIIVNWMITRNLCIYPKVASNRCCVLLSKENYGVPFKLSSPNRLYSLPYFSFFFQRYFNFLCKTISC